MIEAGKGLNSVIGLFSRFISGLVCTDLLSAIGPAVGSPDYSNDCRPVVPGTACQQGYEYIGRWTVQFNKVPSGTIILFDIRPKGRTSPAFGPSIRVGRS